MNTAAPNYRVLAQQLHSSKQWDRLSECARKWLASEPGNLGALLAAGDAAVYLKQFSEARSHIQRVLQREVNALQREQAVQSFLRPKPPRKPS